MKILVVDDSSSGADLVATLRQKRDVEVATANPPYTISANEDGSIEVSQVLFRLSRWENLRTRPENLTRMQRTEWSVSWKTASWRKICRCKLRARQ